MQDKSKLNNPGVIMLVKIAVRRERPLMGLH